MKKLIVLIFMLLPLGVFAQDKIAIVNTADIFNIMPEVSAVEKQLATLNEQYDDAGRIHEEVFGIYVAAGFVDGKH